MADGSNKFKNSINLNPQSSDPSNPAEGDVFRSDGTSRTKGLWEYKDNVWTQIGSGAGGGTTINLGATVTAWENFTPTGSPANGTRTVSKYRRIGDTIFINIKWNTTAGFGSTNPDDVLPPGLSIDTEKLIATQTGERGRFPVGKWHFADLGSNSYTGVLEYREDTDAFTMRSGVGTTIPSPASDTVTYQLELPIQGWSVADIPTSTDGVVVRGAGNGGTSLTAGTTNIDFTEVEDTASAWDGSQFTAPETANYSISGSVNFTTTANRFISAYIDGTLSKILGAVTLSSGAFYGEVKLNQGEVLSIRSEQTGTLLSSSTFHHIHIQRLGFNTIINREGVYKNYMEPDNSSIEEDIGDWVAYADAAATTPVDGVDGSPTITATRNTTAALRGTGDLLFTKDAANRQGEGISCPFVIDIADRAKKLTISFDYSTSANYADGDVKIFIYDLTNSNLIRVNGEDLKAVSGQSTHYAQFQTAPDSTNYRLIIHQSTTDATAYTINLDNIRVGPTNLARGAIVTDWEDFTPSITGGGTATWSSLNGKFRRVGDSLEMSVSAISSAAGSGGSVLKFLYPNGLLLDTTKNAGSAGVGREYNLGTVSNTWAVFDVTANTDGVIFQEAGSPGAYVGSDVTSSSQINFTCRVPIQGWSSEAVMSEDLGGREIIVEARGNGGGGLTSGTTDIDWITVEKDSTAAWDGTTFTVPETGTYLISGFIRLTAGAAFGMRAYIDTVQDKYLVYDIDTNSAIHHFQETFRLEKGQQVTFRSVVSSPTLQSSDLHRITIVKLASPQTILETETVAARYSSNAGQAIPTSLGTTFKAEDIDYDTHNAYDTTTGEYTVPVSGKYDIKIRMHADPSDSLSTNAFFQIVLYVNGSSKEELGFIKNDSSGTLSEFSANGSAQIDLEKGDIVSITFRENSTDTTNLSASNSQNVFSIARIK